MGPVSFERIGHGLDPDALRALARRIAEHGIEVKVLDQHECLIVRSEDAERARGLMTPDADPLHD